MITGADIVKEARTWLGTRYQHQASLKGVACDCIGLVRGVAREVGLVDPFESGAAAKFVGYDQLPNSGLLIEACESFMDRIRVADALPGDVLVMRFETEPQHFGFVSGNDPRYMIHCFAMSRRVVEHRVDDVWASRMTGAYRLRGAA